MRPSSISRAFVTAIAVGGAAVSTSSAEAGDVARGSANAQSSKLAFSETARAQLFSRRAALKRRAQPDDPEGWEKQFLHQLKVGSSFEDRMKRGNAFKAYQKYFRR